MIYVYSFYYSHASNGIRLTYELVSILNRNGISSKNLCFDKYNPEWHIPFEYEKNTIYLSQEKVDIKTEDIVIYPEQIVDNPLSANRVIRLLLNKPYFIFGTGINYSSTDYIISYSKIISNKYPQMYYMIDERQLFKQYCGIPSDPSMCTIYFGKTDRRILKQKRKQLATILKKYSKIKVICRNIPSSREETLLWIKQSSLLISFDAISNINYEATLLGVPVILMDDSFNIKEHNLNVEQTGYCESIQDILFARSTVQKSYLDYEKYLFRQETIIIKVIQDAIKHFECIENDKHYEDINARRLEIQKEIDYLEYKKVLGRRQLQSIRTYKDIPWRIRRILHV